MFAEMSPDEMPAGARNRELASVQHQADIVCIRPANGGREGSTAMAFQVDPTAFEVLSSTGSDIAEKVRLEGFEAAHNQLGRQILARIARRKGNFLPDFFELGCISY